MRAPLDERSFGSAALRRVIGGLVTTNPYRLAEGVTLSVVEPHGAASRSWGGPAEIPAGSHVPPAPDHPVASRVLV